MTSFVDIASYGHGAFKVIIVAAVLIILQLQVVGGRFLSRKMRKVSLAADDYVLLTATIFTVGLCALALAFPRIAGIGAPIMVIQMEEVSDGKVLGQSFMAWLILYGLSIALSKCAILLLYLRVFTTSNKAFTVSVYLMGFVVIATGIASIFVAIFQCSPVAYEWDKSIQGGKCIDEVAFARYTAIPNVDRTDCDLHARNHASAPTLFPDTSKKMADSQIAASSPAAPASVSFSTATPPPSQTVRLPLPLFSRPSLTHPPSYIPDLDHLDRRRTRQLHHRGQPADPAPYLPAHPARLILHPQQRRQQAVVGAQQDAPESRLIDGAVTPAIRGRAAAAGSVPVELGAWIAAVRVLG
ncbi:MAG: hypothetical protein ASARMPREDX12_007649 [Alectoria sarmentosa]|nr:MAG: hypothetical protein ASARMPREDX12_007649 [Alectoria sarmentosa]